MESEDRLREIEQRLAAIGPEEWTYVEGTLKHYVDFGHDDEGVGLQELHWFDGHVTHAEFDAKFIAHAPADIRYLVERVKCLLLRLNELEGQLVSQERLLTDDSADLLDLFDNDDLDDYELATNEGLPD